MASLELRPISARIASAWAFNSGETRARIIPVLEAVDRRVALGRAVVVAVAGLLGIFSLPPGSLAGLYPDQATAPMESDRRRVAGSGPSPERRDAYRCPDRPADPARR